VAAPAAVGTPSITSLLPLVGKEGGREGGRKGRREGRKNLNLLPLTVFSYTSPSLPPSLPPSPRSSFPHAEAN